MTVKHRILIVDDESAVLFGLRKYFDGLGYNVDCASELEEALALIAHVVYQVVLVDMRLTGTHGAEGLDVIGFVRETSPRTRVVLLTAYGSAELTAEARQRGADAVLSKPKPLSEIAQVVQDLIGSPP